MEQAAYPTVWNLSSLFPNNSPADSIETIHHTLDQLEKQTAAFSITNASADAAVLHAIIQSCSELQLTLSQVLSYTACRLSEAPDNEHSSSLRSKATACQLRFFAIVHRFYQKLSQIDEEKWTAFAEDPSLRSFALILKEWRARGRKVQDQEETKAKVAGYHSLGQRYRAILDSLRVKLTAQGQEKELSIGQATNLRSHPSRNTRKKAHHALDEVWKQHEHQMADILNGIIGFRLESAKQQDLPGPLGEALRENRVAKETLEAMWQVIQEHKQPFANYLHQKARLLGEQRLASYDFWAPVNESPLNMPFSEAADFLLAHFGETCPEMKSFTQHAFIDGWIEAENRPGKSAVAFCAGFPKTGESRIFLTYDGSFSNLLTMVHELGHAFHNHALKDEIGILQKYPMSLGETASTFAELTILDSALSKAETDEEKLFLLDEKIKRSTMNLMNIHARFLFEERLCDERENGVVPASRINSLMLEALDEAYVGSMDELPAYSWISTPHFYITSTPFYNFPYTFGYLLAVNLYARAVENGADFESRYMALLRDSGKMPAEDLVMKHIGEDITKPAFWKKGLDLCIQDVETFIRLAASIEGAQTTVPS